MATGENNTTWGDVTNLNLGTALEEAIVGSADVTFASADVTLTLTDTNASQTARNMRLRCTGTTGGSTRNLIVPSIEKPYIVRNDCADSVVVKTAAGTGITVPAGKTMWVYSDATNVVDAVTHLSSLTLSTPLPVSSGGTGVNTSLTAGSVVFAGASGAYSQDNANFFWDNANDRLGIGINTPAIKLQVSDVDQATARIGVNNVNGQNYHLVAGTPGASNTGFAIFDATASATRMYISSAGLVGIGTTSPTALLNVSAGSVMSRFQTGSATDGRIEFAYNTTDIGYLNMASATQFELYGRSGVALALGAGGSERMRITSAGNVGINTSSPIATLDVNGPIYSTGAGYFSGVSALGTNLLLQSVGASPNIQFFRPGQNNWFIGSPDASGDFYISEGTASTYRMYFKTGGNVGIGTATPASPLNIVRDNAAFRGQLSLQTVSAANFAQITFYDQSTLSGQIYQGYGTDKEINIVNPLASGIALWTTNTERMRIDASGNVGIGTSSPQSQSGFGAITSNGSTGGAIFLTTADTRTAQFYNTSTVTVLGSVTSIPLTFVTTNTERMRIDSSGNVGINSTPSAWSSGYRALQIAGQGAGLFANTTVSQAILGSNGYYNGTNWIYNNSDTAGQYWVDGNVHKWFNAAGGSSGSTISFTERMRIDSSGYISLGSGADLSNSLVVIPGGVSGTPVRRGIKLAADPDGYFDFYINGNQLNPFFRWFNGSSELMRLNGVSGDLGIGTSSPGTRLDVQGTVAGNFFQNLYNDSSNAAAQTLYLAKSFGASGVQFGQTRSSANGFVNLLDAAALTFGTNNTERMRITSSGDVAIGTTGLAYSFTGRRVLGIDGTDSSLIEMRSGGTQRGYIIGDANAIKVAAAGSNILQLETNGAERARIDTSGNLLVGVSSGSNHIFSKNAGNSDGTTNIFEVQNAGSDVVAMVLSATSYGTSNSAGTALRLGRSSTTSRSINAGGTINASGADYAEYMVKAGDFSIEKGEVCGINSDGLLTKDFSEAISFVVKSTDPAYVGGDVWGAGCNDDPDALELARQTVDRIAFSGQVPVNVYNAVPGQYIIPVDAGGSISAEAVSSPTFEQYQLAVGKVIAIEQDGRAKIIVKIA
jgi:hypothetical protein